MKIKGKFFIALSLLAFLAFGQTAVANEFWDATQEKAKSMQKWMDEKIPGTFDVGTRITSFELTNDTDDFIGTVDKLDAVQRHEPTKVFAHWWCPKDYKGFQFGGELTWDMVKARTITSDDGHNDGTLEISGPVASVLVRYVNESGFTPYGGIGMAFMNNTEVAEGWWHHGFSNGASGTRQEKYVAWVNAGSPAWPNNGYTRTFVLEDTDGLVYLGGVDWQWTERVLVDFYIRYMEMEVDHEFNLAFYGDVFSSQTDTFDLTNMAYGIGVKYRFS